jgi:probable rRNA maturation factor
MVDDLLMANYNKSSSSHQQNRFVGLSCDIQFSSLKSFHRKHQQDSLVLLKILLQQVQRFLYKTWYLENGCFLPPSLEVNCSLVSKSTIKQLNGIHRGKHKSTDVLSFPLYEHLRSSQKKDMLWIPPYHLGDIMICWSVLREQARDAGIPWQKEFLYLWTHGLLHLLDFDHERSEDEERIMFKHEGCIVASSWETWLKIVQAKK